MTRRPRKPENGSQYGSEAMIAPGVGQTGLVRLMAGERRTRPAQASKARPTDQTAPVRPG